MEDKILLYSQLSPAEQADIEAYVAQHPECRPVLEEARALGEVFQAAQRLQADPPGDEVLAYYLATRQLKHPAPASLQAAFNRIEARLNTDAALRTRCDLLAQRMADLEATSDTLSHFERVTGHRLQPVPTPVPQPVRPTPVPHARKGRRPVRQPSRTLRRVGAVVGGAFMLYLVLFIISWSIVSPLDKVAAFAQDDLIGMGVLRSATPTATLTNEQRYEQALVLLRDVRTSTLGLFPHYDATRLQTAGSLLADIVDQQSDESMLHHEAAYLLAKVRLAQHDVPAAREALAQIINSDDGWRKVEAEALLEQIRALEE